MARTCEEAANQHDRAAARCQHSAEHPARGEHATEKKRDIAVDHSDNQEWAALARSLTTANVIDFMNPDQSLDPLRLWTSAQQKQRHTLTLLSMMEYELTGGQGGREHLDTALAVSTRVGALDLTFAVTQTYGPFTAVDGPSAISCSGRRQPYRPAGVTGPQRTRLTGRMAAAARSAHAAAVP